MEVIDTIDVGTLCDKYGVVLGYRAKTRRGELVLRQASYRHAERMADAEGDLEAIAEAEEAHQRFLDFLAAAV